MQRIERYGVIALVFLLVTVAAVSFWGDGAQEKAKKPGGEAELARAEPAAKPPAGQTPRQDPAPQRPRQEPRRLSSQPAEQESMSAPLPVGPATDPQSAERGAARAKDPLSGMVPLDGLAHGDRRREGERGRAERELAAATPPVQEPAQPVAQAPQLKTQAPQPKAEAQPKPAATLLSPAEMEVLGEPPPARGPQTVEYVVKPGDTLGGIALATLGSTRRVQEIQALNPGLDPARIQAGQKLRLPKGAVFAVAPGSAPTVSSTAKPKVNGGGNYHTIQAGDTLSRIAAARLGDATRWREIVELNPGLDPNRLFVGARISLPAGEAPAPPAAQVAAATPPARERRVR